jgi:hypothetical protein
MDARADWCHTNAISYHAGLDQIALSVHTFNEIWIIDHGTTTKEAAGHTGGRRGKGGDLLYRWGNPRAYGAGGPEDQQLFAQHDVRWIPTGRPGAGHLLVFNNGMRRPAGRYSSVVEIALPLDSKGTYRRARGWAFGPETPCWEYTAKAKEAFYSGHLSGAERLPNGNTLVCAGEQGRVFEVTVGGTVVWDYLNPHQERVGPAMRGGPPGDGQRPRRFRGGPPPRGPRPAGPTTQPQGRRRPFPGRGPAFGPGGPPGGGPHGGGLFRALRYAPDHLGVRTLRKRGVDDDRS